MNSREFLERLKRRARNANLTLELAWLAPLEAYYQLLSKWNAVVNLTAFKLTPAGEDEAIDRLLIEPLIAARHVAPGASRLLDAGSGGGSPAIPLKIAAPYLHLRMVEVKTRKAVFLREAARELALDDVEVETSRFEELLSKPHLHEALDIVSMRAVRVEPAVLMNLQAFLRPGGELFLFRGPGGVQPEAVVPPLVWKATFPLVETLRSRLVVLRKVDVRPRG